MLCVYLHAQLQGHLFTNLVAGEHGSLTQAESWCLAFFIVISFAALAIYTVAAVVQRVSKEVNKGAGASKEELAPSSCFPVTEGVRWGWTSTGSSLCSGAEFLLNWHSRLVGRRHWELLFAPSFIRSSGNGTVKLSQMSALHLGAWHFSRAQQPGTWVVAPFAKHGVCVPQSPPRTGCEDYPEPQGFLLTYRWEGECQTKARAWFCGQNLELLHYFSFSLCIFFFLSLHHVYRVICLSFSWDTHCALVCWSCLIICVTCTSVN